MCVIWIEGVCFELYSGYNDFWLHTIIKDNFFFLQEKRLINDMHVLNLSFTYEYHRASVFLSRDLLEPFYLLCVKCIVSYSRFDSYLTLNC